MDLNELVNAILFYINYFCCLGGGGFTGMIKEKGFKRIRLGVLHNNQSGLKFWENRGFKVIKEMYSTIKPKKDWIIKVMDKEI